MKLIKDLLELEKVSSIMKKISILELLIQDEEAKYMDELNKKNKDVYLKLIGDADYLNLIKTDAILFYLKYLVESSNKNDDAHKHEKNILNKFINIESYVDADNYNTILFQLINEFNKIKYPFTDRYFELLEQICIYKLYKYLYETYKLDDEVREDEKFAIIQLQIYNYLENILSLSKIKGSYENTLISEFAERILSVEEKLKEKGFNADLMYFTYCRTTLNKCEKEKARQRAIKKYYSNNYNFKETEK